MIDPDDAQVTYTVRELLADLKNEQAKGFVSLEVKLAAKADKGDVARMESRLDAHTKKIGDLEAWRHDKELAASVHGQRDERSWASRHRVLTALGSAALICATLFGPYLAAHPF